MLPLLAGTAAALVGALVAWRYHALGLTLSHYDARGHLIVARRVIDSLTPGWQQIGAVWLPLPHLLNVLPVQHDVMYRTGASGVAISIFAFALATGSIVWIVERLTGSGAGALAAAAVFAANPNLLYLQATPMTEPLLLGTTLAGVALLVAWIDGDASTRAAGSTIALACLTRYEAWPVIAAALAAAAWTLWRRGAAPIAACRRVLPVAVYPATAMIGFLVFSRVVVGQWFVSSGFFVPENKALGDPLLAAAEIWYGTHLLSGYAIIAIATVGVAALAIQGLLVRGRAQALIALSLFATAALPWSAFVKGHPFRIRYMIPLLAIEAIGAGMAASLVRRARVAAAILLIAAAGYELHPLDLAAPMVVEAQWDRPNGPVRRQVTGYLRAHYDGTKIMASMGSLGHYMQEASLEGFVIRDFLHEGNGDIWLSALTGPRPFAGWVLIEEKANGGDMLAKIVRENPRWLDGYARVAEGAGLALYRRAPR